MLKKLNKNHPRLFRTLLSFLVVFCLIFNLVTTPVYALEVAAAQWIGVAATSVIASALILLGIQRDPAQPSVFDTLVDSLQIKLQESGLVYGNGLIDVLACQESDGGLFYAAQVGLLTMILDTLLDMGFISLETTNGYEVEGGTQIRINDYGLMCSCDSTAFFARSGESSVYGYVILVSTDPEAVFTDLYPFSSFQTSRSELILDGVTYYYASNSVRFSSIDDAPYVPGIVAQVVEQLLTGQVEFDMQSTLQQGLKEGETLIVDLSILEQLMQEGKIQGGNYDNGEDQPAIPYVRLGLGQTYEETATKTQQDVWEGLSDYTTSVLDNWGALKQNLQSFKFTFGSIKTILQNIWDLLSSLATTITAPITSLLSPILEVLTSIRDSFGSSSSGSTVTSPGVNSYAFDLTSFFPFCIPFDIYNMLNAFCAEPVTPRWELNLDFGALGSYPVVIDFAPWNQLAAVCRMFQVVLFCVGLAAGTKKLLGW